MTNGHLFWDLLKITLSYDIIIALNMNFKCVLDNDKGNYNLKTREVSTHY